MWANVVVAVIALAGALIPVFWGTGQGTRDRKALKEEAELLDALPTDLEARADLRSHLNHGLTAYIALANPSAALAAKTKRWMWGYWVAGIACAIAALTLLILYRQDEVPGPIAIPIAGGLALLAYGLALLSFLKFNRSRRLR